MGKNIVSNIEGRIAGGVTAGLYRVSPWHKHGDVRDANGTLIGVKRKLDDDVRNPSTIKVLADLDWEPEEIDLGRLTLPSGINIVSSQKMLVRRGWPTWQDAYDLGVHSDKYGVLTNDVGIGFVVEILRHRSDATLRSVTTLYGGKVIFAVVEFRDEVRVTRGTGEQRDKHTRFMGVYWSHDGSHPLGVKYMNHEWVCENTFTPWNAETGLVVRHTRHADDRAADALRAIEGMMKAQDALDLEIERLLDIEVSQPMELVRQVIGARPAAKVTLGKTGVGQNDRAGINWDKTADGMMAEWRDYTTKASAFDFVMAVQGFEQHRSKIKGGGRDVKTITRLIRDDYPLTAKAAKLFAVAE